MIRIFMDGGMFIMLPILAMFITILVYFSKALRTLNTTNKNQEIVAALGWLAFAWGFLGQTIGLIGAFDAVAAAGDISPSILASGLKRTLIGAFSGTFAFLISRLGIVILVFLKKKGEEVG